RIHCRGDRLPDRTWLVVLRSELQPFEYSLGYCPDHKHDGSPVSWSVYRVMFVANTPADALRDALGRAPQWPLGDRFGHGGVNEPGLDVHYLHIALEQASAQALQEKRDHPLGAPVDVVGLTSTVAGHRRDHRDTAAALSGQAIGESCNQ